MKIEKYDALGKLLTWLWDKHNGAFVLSYTFMCLGIGIIIGVSL